jgi:phosphohistidine phosphatase
MPTPTSYELYFIRHGVAEERGDSWPDDTKRPLSASGMSRLRKGARGLVNAGVTFDVVLTSPLVRTRQTAEILAAAFDPRPPIVAAEGLAPGATYQGVLVELEKQSRRARIALVGHETSLGEVAARFAGSRHAFPFKKGAVCRIDIERLPPAGPGSLRWFLTPRMLRAIKR